MKKVKVVENSDKDSLWTKLNKGYNPMVEGVRWTENYADKIEKVWGKLPSFVGTFLATFAVFIVGSSLRGEWIIIMVHFMKQIGYSFIGQSNVTVSDTEVPFSWDNLSMEYFSLQGWQPFVFYSIVVSYVIYFGIGGFIHWYFYVRQRDRPHEWKCQPDKFMSAELERHEILFGSASLLLSALITGFLATYASNGGYYLTIYYKMDQHGWLWFLLQGPVVFIYQDYVTYLIHRLYHTPWLYKNFHKLHHKYKQPTAFSVTAIHPVEITHIQLTLLLPIVVLPLHWLPFYVVELYTYYHGIIDHSGVTFKAQWWQPWQPDCIFHDNHHQYFHVNFGFNIFLWDKLHGTYRQKDRIYTEDYFYGKGKALDEVPEDVLLNDIKERKSENPLAYKQNKLVYDFNESDINKIKSKNNKKNNKKKS